MLDSHSRFPYSPVHSMNRDELLTLARRVLTLPTAPYHEPDVKAFVLEFCRRLPGVRVEQDRVGNVIARYHRGAAKTPLVFVAHMDHPGFEMLDGNRAEFLGGVPREMFAKGIGVRVYGATGVRRVKLARFNVSAWPKRKLDRKSTRLNSSHRCISYAVF